MKPTLLFILTCLLLVSCKPSEERRPLSSNSGSFIDSSIERNKQLNNREYAQIENYIQDSKKSFQSSEYGFWYAYHSIHMHFDYVLKTLQDQVIYPNKKKETQLYYVDQQELFSGLREGLKLMKEGESITFIFPSQKAYGYYGDENKIGRNVPLICEVSLLKLTNN